MTKPSDFTPDHALEVESAQRTRSLQRDVWVLRGVGAVLLVIGWLAVIAHTFGSTFVILDTIVFATLGGYAFIAAAFTRRNAVNLEKRLRLDLLVHNMELENMAMRDDLTQLFNRRYLFERLERELQTAKGFDRPMSVILLDLDGLKAVNDTYGHRVGDTVLANFGRFLLNQTRASDVPARIGGDEFAIILPDTSQAAADVMVTRLSRAMEDTDLMEEGELNLCMSASLGVSGYPWGGDNVDGIMQQADTGMYTNKRARRQNGQQEQQPEPSPNGSVPVIFRQSTEAEGATDEASPRE